MTALGRRRVGGRMGPWRVGGRMGPWRVVGRMGPWRVGGRMGPRICRIQSLACSPETIATRLISYRSTQNKELLKKEKNYNF